MTDRVEYIGTPCKVAPAYILRRGENLIDAPLRATWRCLINYPSWQNFRRVQHISGRPGAEGEVVLLEKAETGFTFPRYYARTIVLQPERKVIWKQFADPASQGLDFFGIVTFSAVAAQHGTSFSYDLLYEFLIPYREEEELGALSKRQYENFDALLSVVVPKLKHLAESER